jgi:hypothetical protein
VERNEGSLSPKTPAQSPTHEEKTGKTGDNSSLKELPVGDSTPIHEVPLVKPLIEVHALGSPHENPVDAPAPAPKPPAQKAESSGQGSSGTADKTAIAQGKIVHDVDKDSPEEGETPNEDDTLDEVELVELKTLARKGKATLSVFGVMAREGLKPIPGVVTVAPTLRPYNLRDMSGFHENPTFLRTSHPEGEPLPEAILVTREVIDAAVSTCDKSILANAVKEALTDSDATIARLRKDVARHKESNVESRKEKAAKLAKIGSDMGRQLEDVRNSIRNEFHSEVTLDEHKDAILKLKSELEKAEDKIRQLERRLKRAETEHGKRDGETRKRSRSRSPDNRDKKSRRSSRSPHRSDRSSGSSSRSKSDKNSRFSSTEFSARTDGGRTRHASWDTRGSATLSTPSWGNPKPNRDPDDSWAESSRESHCAGLNASEAKEANDKNIDTFFVPKSKASFSPGGGAAPHAHEK